MMTDILERAWRVGKVALLCAALGVAVALLVGSITDDAEAKKRHRSLPPTTFAFRHTSSAANTLGNCTVIDNPLINGNPSAILVVTHTQAKFNLLDSPLHASYSDAIKRWSICREDGSDMPTGQVFNVIAGFGIDTTTGSSGSSDSSGASSGSSGGDGGNG